MLKKGLGTALSTLAAVTALSACGGGGGDAPPTETTAVIDPIDKYLGAWEVPCFSWRSGGSPGDPDNRSTRAESIVTKIDRHKVSTTTEQYDYTNTTCTEPATVTHSTSSVELDGTKVIDFGEVDRLIYTSDLGAKQAIAQVVDNKFYGTVADLLTPVDAQGYPTSIDENSYSIRDVTP